MSVAVTYESKCTVLETLEANIDSLGSDKQVTHNQFNTSQSLTNATTPPVTKVAAAVVALVDSAKTIDLTELTGTNGVTVNGTGLKVQVLKFKNKEDSANAMSIVPGETNGYDLGGADMKVTLQPGQEVTLYGNDASPDIGGTDKTLDLAGTAVQECELMIVMG